ncbi:MAG TPA: hypothetical protein VMT34_12360 [Aggregatilineales bacterium]|nr:hypothetical protein [Aggregatilineales bacterium]
MEQRPEFHVVETIDSGPADADPVPVSPAGASNPGEMSGDVGGTGVRALASEVPGAEIDQAATPVYSPIDLLTQAIQQHPDLPGNYLLRAEVYFRDGDEERAADDFRQALTLAQARVDTVDWGYIYQSYIDRAHEGLRRCGL